MTERTCPRSHPKTPHAMRQDGNGWYCPLERDAELEAAHLVRQAEIAELEAAFALPGTDKETPA